MSPSILILIAFMLLGWLINWQLKRKIKIYSVLPLSRDISGKEIVEMMLSANGITGVRISSTKGILTDHYNPANKTINLSRAVFYGRNIVSAAVAAHECGHAIQHSKGYPMLRLRSKIVPIVSLTSKWIHWVLLAGVLLISSFPQILLFGIILFSLSVIFSLITIPVELNASRRALQWLVASRITTYETIPQARNVLKWAAYTYVLAALSSLATLIYYVMLLIGKKE